MSDPDQPSDSVLASLGVDLDSVDIPVPDDLWDAMLAVAFDPETPTADSSLVPVMDDNGDLPDDGADDGGLVLADDSPDHEQHSDHHGDEVTLIDHDPGLDHHDPGIDGSTPDHGDDHPHGHEDHGWHV